MVARESEPDQMMTVGAGRASGAVRRLLCTTVAMCIAGLAFGLGSAGALELTHHSFSSSFKGSGSSEGEFGGTVADVAVDEATDTVYVATTRPGGVVDKFDASGNPVPFTDPGLGGATTVSLGATNIGVLTIAVDNSPTATNGRIYVSNKYIGNGNIWAFNRDGSPVGGNFPLEKVTVGAFGVDPSSGDLWIAREGIPRRIERYTSTGVTTGERLVFDTKAGPYDLELDSDGNLYALEPTFQGEYTGIGKYGSDRLLKQILPYSDTIAVDPVTDDLYSLFGTEIHQYTSAGTEVAVFSPSSAGPNSIAVNGSTGSVYVGSPSEVDILAPGATVTVPEAITGNASNFEPTSVDVHGTVDPDGIDTTDCHVEWSTDESFSNSTPCAGGNVVSGTGPQSVTAEIAGLTQGQTYHYRLVAANSNGSVIGRPDLVFVPSTKPTIDDQWAAAVRTDGATLKAIVNPGGAASTVRVEYGKEDCSIATCSSTSKQDLGTGLSDLSATTVISGLEADTEYHFRLVATNQSGTEYGPDETLRTFANPTEAEEDCSNAHVRQQTGAVALPDCRAYELVSAADTDGYNLESDLVAGQTPFGGYPEAESRALYGVHSGAVPGPWNPTNRGVDPYLASRGEDGWETEYVGIPADAPSSGPFSSTLAEADAQLQLFAFGGPDLCDPCFEDSSRGLPLRPAGGVLTQGMKGSIAQPTATPGGVVEKHFSADSRHLLFGSTAQFEPEGNDNGTDVTIYDRDRDAGATQVVSTLPDGSTIANGSGVAALDISADGSRVVIGRQLTTGPGGNRFYHLYMHLGDSPNSVDLTPNATQGVAFNGMSADGSRAFFTTVDHLLSPDDSDGSSDIYEATVDESGSTALRLVSVDAGGAPSNDDSCDPAGTPSTWNSVSGDGNCNPVAIAGGGGVASEEGTFFFISPESLDTSDAQNLPIPDQPNLYVVRPDQTPHFVATIDSSLGKPGPPLPQRPTNTEFIKGLSRPNSITVDQSNGDLYLIIPEQNELKRFDSTGAPKDFTDGPGAGGNTISGFSFYESDLSQVAVDNSGGARDGNFYVTDTYAFPALIRVFDNTGAEIGSLSGSGTPTGSFVQPSGVAVDQSNGDVYVSDASASEPRIWRYSPSPISSSVAESDYSGGIAFPPFDFEFLPTNIAVASGKVYPKFNSSGDVREYSASDFEPSPPEASYTILTTGARASVAIDPSTGDIYVNKGNRIEVFDSAGNSVESFGSGVLSFSSSVALSTAPGPSNRHVYAASGFSRVVDFGYFLPPYTPIDHPAVVHGVNQPESRAYGDFQITSDGRLAAFGSVLSLTGFKNGGFAQVFRYDETGQVPLTCVSCGSTNALPEGDSSLASGGLSLLDDGRVFFNSADPLAPLDLNSRQDVYEWDGHSAQLISSGNGPFDSSLLGASADGTDAFFFTKDTLVPEDENGTLVKLYDARAGGGFPFIPPPIPCKASDECHGAGSEAAPAPEIRTIRGANGNDTSKKRCKRGKVRKRGKCVPKKKRRGAQRGKSRRREQVR